ncbi:MAG: tRNA-binding protein [Candidatus Nanohaloarchaea archaeon]
MTESPFDVEIQVGTVQKAEKFEEARKPEMVKLWISVDDREFQSAAQLGHNYSIKELEGRQVMCATNLGEMKIAGFTSEALTVGVPNEEGEVILVAPDEEVPEGGTLFGEIENS